MEFYYTRCKTIFIATVFLVCGIAGNLFSQEVPLKNLNDFVNPSSNWKTADDLTVNPLTGEPFIAEKGSRIIIGSASSSNEISGITTKMTHVDLVVEFDMMLTPGAAASIWLQGRYGLKLADNWNKREGDRLDNGALIPAKVNGVESIGHAPRQNVARAPGLWQHLKIIFQAPKFNQQGKKIKDAKFLVVRQNGVNIQENQIVSHPSEGASYNNEVSKGPLELKVDKGTVAFRNIEYIASSGKKIKINDLSYKLYVEKFLDEDFFYESDVSGSIQLPDLDSREPNSSGTIDRIHTQMTRDAGQDLALVFNGKLNIPETGKYHFETIPNGLGAFWLNGDELFKWDAVHKEGTQQATAELKKGEHEFKLINVNFGNPETGVFVDGPGIINQPLHQLTKLSEGSSVRPIILDPSEGPLVQRSFVFYENEKLLSSINVGYPNDTHYSLNLSTGGLSYVWKGKFGDVTSMWYDRGLDQVLKPMGSVLSLSPSQQVMFSEKENINSPTDLAYGTFRLIGYDLNPNGEPVFQYKIGNITIQDHITLGVKGRTLTRSLNFISEAGITDRQIWYRLAVSSKIEKVDDRLFSIDDRSYFLELGGDLKSEIKQIGDEQVLLVPIPHSSKSELLSYSLIW